MAIGLTPIHFLLILLIAAVITAPVLVLVLLLMAVRRRDQPDPRAILAERLARGDISREEFDTAMRALGVGRPRSSGSQPPPGA